MNIFVVVKGERGEGYEILAAFANFNRAFAYAAEYSSDRDMTGDNELFREQRRYRWWGEHEVDYVMIVEVFLVK